VTVAVMAPGLIHDLFWDTDVASRFVLAEHLRGHGTVFIPHFGQWTLLWWLLATRDLPGHVQLWEATGYPFALAGAGLLGWATARVTNRWAGVTAAATALVVGPYALRSLLSSVYHVTTPFTAAVLGAYLVVLARSSPRRGAVALAAGVGLLAGTNAASDPLLVPAGVLPFALAAAALFAATRSRPIAVQAGTVLAVTAVSAVATIGVMRGLGFHVVGLDLQPAAPGDLPANTRHLGRTVALLGGANYALPHGYPHEPLRILIALLAAAGIAVCVLAAFTLRRAEPRLRAYALYWAASVLLLAITFVATTNAAALGAGSANYLLTLPLAAAAGIALLAAGSRRAQLIVGLAVAIVGTANLAGIVDGRAGTPKGAIGTHKEQLVSLLERKGVTRGYASYWDAQNLTWQSGGRVFVAPIERCDVPGEPRLCGFNFATIRSWYEEKAGPSFLLVDPTTAFITEPPPHVREASASYKFGPLTVYVFPYDLARYIRPPAS
jgi:hypothetical protein